MTASVGLECHHIQKRFATRQGEVVALADITMHVRPGEFVCIVGPSGCGKSTLLKIMAGLIEPTAGEIVFTQAAGNRTHTAMVFQEHGLFPWLNVLDNVAFGLETQGIGVRDRHAQAHAFIEAVGLAGFAHNYPHELSVGMRQRVAIARAFVANSPILLMDEPFGSLDAQTKLVLQEELLRLWKDDRKLVVYVTHDIDEAIVLGDRIVIMTGRPGHIRDDITVPLDRPRDLADRDHPAVRELRWHIWKALEDEVRQSVGLKVS